MSNNLHNLSASSYAVPMNDVALDAFSEYRYRTACCEPPLRLASEGTELHNTIVT